MAYKALYRKYRPKNFDDVAGQKVIVQILKNSIVSNKISHAYLFYGPRGTGKTSIAKIFAKTINCENVKDGIACGKCPRCIENDSNDAVDIVEIDAASNNGVDEIRELKSKVNLVPSTMKYKVYIIDEVHMLSIGAFNALLKTLEEPPLHVIFILATTELRKVPNTIISRCQLMEFKKISEVAMHEKIKAISEVEKININDDAIKEIIKYSDGGMRDALGLLDKLSLYSGDLICREVVRNICGNAKFEDIEELVTYIKNKNMTSIVDKIDSLYSSGVDLINVVNDLILSLKEDILKNSTYICSIILKLADTLEKMKLSNNPKIVLEASILEFISNDTSENISREIFLNEKKEKKDRINTVLNEEKSEIDDLDFRIEKTNDFNYDEFKKVRINNAFVDADKKILKEIKNKWQDLSKYIFDTSYGAIASSLMDGEVVACSDKYIVIVFKYDSLVEKTNFNFIEVEKFINKLCEKKYKIVSLTNEEWIDKKKEYVSNLKNNKHYIFIPDDFENESYKDLGQKETDKSSDQLVSAAVELFGKENIVLK